MTACMATLEQKWKKWLGHILQPSSLPKKVIKGGTERKKTRDATRLAAEDKKQKEVLKTVKFLFHFVSPLVAVVFSQLIASLLSS